mgnify:CR=1 FL=1
MENVLKPKDPNQILSFFNQRGFNGTLHIRVRKAFTDYVDIRFHRAIDNSGVNIKPYPNGLPLPGDEDASEFMLVSGNAYEMYRFIRQFYATSHENTLNYMESMRVYIK